MVRIAGIQIEKDSKGRPAYARFNLKKHPEALELLHKVGAIDEDDFNKEFEEGWKNGYTPEEFRKKVHAVLKRKFDEKNNL